MWRVLTLFTSSALSFRVEREWVLVLHTWVEMDYVNHGLSTLVIYLTWPQSPHLWNVRNNIDVQVSLRRSEDVLNIKQLAQCLDASINASSFHLFGCSLGPLLVSLGYSTHLHKTLSGLLNNTKTTLIVLSQGTGSLVSISNVFELKRGPRAWLLVAAHELGSIGK